MYNESNYFIFFKSSKILSVEILFFLWKLLYFKLFHKKKYPKFKVRVVKFVRASIFSNKLISEMLLLLYVEKWFNSTKK